MAAATLTANTSEGLFEMDTTSTSAAKGKGAPLVDRSDSNATLVDDSSSSPSPSDSTNDTDHSNSSSPVVQPDNLDFTSTLTDLQLDALNRLRTTVLDSTHGPTVTRHISNPYENLDHMLLRFLRARNYNVDAAWQLLRHDLEWRETNDIPSLLTKTPEQILGCPVSVIHEQMPHWTQGHDKSGRPVMYRGFGHTLVAEWTKHTTVEKALDYHTWYNEFLSSKLGERSIAEGRTVDTFCFVVDAQGWYLGLATRVAYSYLKGMAVSDAAHYPERLGKVIVINAPTLLNVAWKIISGWLDPVTKAKVYITGGEKEWRPVLDELIDREQLIDEYGGLAKSERPRDGNGKPYM